MPDPMPDPVPEPKTEQNLSEKSKQTSRPPELGVLVDLFCVALVDAFVQANG